MIIFWTLFYIRYTCTRLIAKIASWLLSHFRSPLTKPHFSSSLASKAPHYMFLSVYFSLFVWPPSLGLLPPRALLSHIGLHLRHDCRVLLWAGADRHVLVVLGRAFFTGWEDAGGYRHTTSEKTSTCVARAGSARAGGGGVSNNGDTTAVGRVVAGELGLTTHGS